MDKSDKLFFAAKELSQLVHDRTVSPVEAVEAYLGRIDNLNYKLYACLTVCQEEALEAARESEQARGEKRGPLHGVPFALKDQLNTAGIRTRSGTAF
jgi:Asp-tRNA(Asn)/Glu-tRNA(Gln) amidotransferase A subunit family amidase